ncbi:hypothetical protein MRX96_059224 [Rhipicephalus microplus]
MSPSVAGHAVPTTTWSPRLFSAGRRSREVWRAFPYVPGLVRSLSQSASATMCPVHAASLLSHVHEHTFLLRRYRFLDPAWCGFSVIARVTLSLAYQATTMTEHHEG